jgi:hypothetical protein
MKNILGQGPVLVAPPDVTLRPNVMERPSSAHLNPPSVNPQHRPKEHDKRPDVATGEALQRVRARQTEARTAQDCHARTRRRPRDEAPGA